MQLWLFVLVAAMLLALATPASARRINGGLAGGILVPPANAPAPGIPPQLDITGYLETATVDPTMCPTLDPRLWGGTARINGQLITIPCNTILQMPAFATSWADLFTAAPKDIMPAGSKKSGLALGDAMANGTAGLLDMTWAPQGDLPTTYNAPLPAHEFHVVGNTINGQNIAGLIFISQQSLNGGQGVISCIDYATGELQVGGTPLPHGSPCPVPDGSFTRVRFNDPVGRFGIVHGGPNSAPGTVDVIEPGYDPRYTADTDNPTMHSALGYPVCIPAFNPFNQTIDPITGLPIPATIDAKCPIYNRPIAPKCNSFNANTLLPAFGAQPTNTYCTTWVMDPPGAHALKADASDPTLSAPLVIGDTIGFHGTMKADAKGPYISAHTIDANLGIYTQPHIAPSYVFVEALGVGTGGGTVGGVATESTNKVFWVGFSTDPTELVDFYSLHQDPQTGAQTAYLQGTFDPCCTPLGRFRSPVNNLGVFGEPQRNYQAVSRTMCQTTPPSAQLQTVCTMAPLVNPDPTAVVVPKVFNQNGLAEGQYTLPNFGFIFGENLAFGGPIIPANFQDIPFLFCGSGPLDGFGTASPRVGQLVPAPWASPMADPLFHSSLCPNEAAVGAAAGVVTPPPAPLPASISLVTSAPTIAPLGATTAVALAVTATDPNTPPIAMSFGWTFTAPKGVAVSMSCGTCLPNAGSAHVTATITVAATATPGPIVFTVSASNGVLPAATAGTTVTVPAPLANAKPPIIVKTIAPGSVASGQLVTLQATGNTNPLGGTVTFAFKQTSGPNVYLNGVPVPLGQTIPSTFVGTAASNTQGAFTRFTSPISLVKPPNMVFQVTETDTRTSLTTSQSITISEAPFVEAVTVPTVTYRQIVSRVGAPAEFGKFNLIATSTAFVAPPAGWTMNATLTAKLANGTISAPVVVPMLLTPADPVGTPVGVGVCGATPCFAGATTGVIVDATVTPPIFVAPDTIVVRSSLGGSNTVLLGDPNYVIR
jgi:hypothetical protein